MAKRTAVRSPLGSQIRKRRKTLGMTGKALARAVGVSTSYISQLEQGHQEDPSVAVLGRLAKALATDVAALLGAQAVLHGPATVPDALQAMAEAHHLAAETVQMLARMHIDGRAPASEEDWLFVWLAVQYACRLPEVAAGAHAAPTAVEHAILDAKRAAGTAAVRGGEQTRTCRVLFLCTHNSARSQMAEGWLRHLGGKRVDAYSAGTEATQVRPLAVRAMAEVGIDIAGQESKTLDRYLGQPFDAVITVCDQANATCPVFAGARQRLHWSLPDPSQAAGSEEEQLAMYRAVRDDLRTRIEQEVLPALAP